MITEPAALLMKTGLLPASKETAASFKHVAGGGRDRHGSPFLIAQCMHSALARPCTAIKTQKPAIFGIFINFYIFIPSINKI
jgi:hypothetical protein